MPEKLSNRTKIAASNTPLAQPSANVTGFNEIIAVLTSQTEASPRLGKRGPEDQSGSSGTSSKDSEGKKTTGVIRITNLFTALFH